MIPLVSQQTLNESLASLQLTAVADEARVRALRAELEQSASAHAAAEAAVDEERGARQSVEADAAEVRRAAAARDMRSLSLPLSPLALSLIGFNKAL